MTEENTIKYRNKKDFTMNCAFKKFGFSNKNVF